MAYLSVAETAIRWGISERSVRNYCAQERVPGAYLAGKTWKIPEDVEKPERQSGKPEKTSTLADILKREKDARLSGGIYHRVQIDLTYNSNHIEGSRLTHDQTRYIFETNTIGLADQSVNVDDVVETANHFRCVDRMIEDSTHLLSETWIKQMHGMLKSGTSDSRQRYFAVGDYKKMPNEVGGRPTAPPEEVAERMKALLNEYNAFPQKTFDELLKFHVDFERIHPFQDGNGRVGRLILFKECLRCGIVPFILTDEKKLYYYRGLAEWDTEKGYLRDTCLAAQDQFKATLDYFRIPYENEE